MLSLNDQAGLRTQFLVKALPPYNNYKVTAGDANLDNNTADLKTTTQQLASWLIVVDVSDPAGRKQTINASACVAARLVSLMSPMSNVRILAMAGAQETVGVKDEHYDNLGSLMTEGELNATPIAVIDKGQIQFGHAGFAQIITGLTAAQSVHQDSTYLWIGLSRALKEQMPRCASGFNQNMPKGVILISDGVDESTDSSENLKNLIATSKELGIPIHTIAFPHKDHSKNKSLLHKGFDALQKLANDTNGGFLNYASDISDPNNLDCIKRLDHLLKRTSASVLELEVPITDVPSASSLRVTLQSGKSNVGIMTVPQEKVGTVVAEHAMLCLYQTKQQALKEQLTEDSTRALITGMAKIFADRILPLRNYQELFETTQVNADFANRVQQFLQHIDKYEALRNSSDISIEAAFCMMDYKRPLPEPPTGDTHVTANVQTGPISSGSSTSSADDYETDAFKSWVWWTLGLGGVCFFIVLFLLIIRTLTRSDEYDTAEDAGSPASSRASAAPVLASLVDVNNPSRCWDISKTTVTVGRGTAADVRLPSDHVSSLHFALTRNTSGQWIIKDTNSTNGTAVNGTMITASTPINNGDTITLADMQLAFRLR